MHMPSKKVFDKMQATSGALWYVPSTGDGDVAFLVKSNTPSIKAAMMGCPINLYFGKMQNYLCLGIIFYDVPDMPTCISNVQMNSEDHVALLRCLKLRRFPAFFFNEMNVCVAWTYFNIPEETAQQAIDFIGNISDLHVGEINKKLGDVLDDFEIAIEKTVRNNKLSELAFSIIPEPEAWHGLDVHFLSNTDSKCINISNSNEGNNFENTIWSLFAQLFPDNVYKSPQIKYGEKEREFTDVLAFYDLGSFIIETKDLSVIKAGYERSKEKRLAGIQKQVTKAINQLKGAVKHFANGDELLDSNGCSISVDRSTPPHCIVLITELFEYGDWSKIVLEMLAAFVSTKAYFHLLDESELLTYIIASNNNPELLDYYLIERFNLFVKKKSVFIRCQIEPPNCDNNLC